MKRLQAQGTGTKKKQAEPLTEEQEEILWEKGLLRDATHSQLQDKPLAESHSLHKPPLLLQFPATLISTVAPLLLLTSTATLTSVFVSIAIETYKASSIAFRDLTVVEQSNSSK